jgi:hypothetical protein
MSTTPTRLTFRMAAAGAMGAAVLASSAHAASPDVAQLSRQIERLTERLQQLEQRNRQLEERLGAAVAAPAAPVAPAPAAAPVVAAPAPALPAPAGAVAMVEPEEDAGLQVEGSIVGVMQRTARASAADRETLSRANYRGDVTLALPMGQLSGWGDAKLDGFGHVRFGQGTGLALRPTHTATGNSVAFESAGGSDETYAIVAQAWLQATWAMGGSGLNDQPGNRVELTVGKMDVFGFFDQNNVAADEASQFLNNAFVHNPLLDSGGDIAADAYGLAPGLRLAWIDEGEDRGWGWGLSAGVLGSGAGANFNGGLGRPMVIVQAEITPKQINGEARGAFRLYGWTNGHTTDLLGNEQRHSGWGLSMDHKVGRDWNLFGRYGQRTQGDGAFNKALTVGFEHGGRAWGRGHDALGLAVGWLRTSSAWQSATLADPTLVGYSASGNERLAELYYRMKLSEKIELTPDVQIIQRPGGDEQARRVTLWGLRAAIGF